jgi:anti-anti-sigma regulatory factor
MAMSIELYSEEIIVIAAADKRSDFKIWLRMETPDDLVSDLRWLCGELVDSHIILDLSHMVNLETASYGLMLDLQRLAEESDCRLVLCSLSPHLKQQFRYVHLLDAFDMFDTCEAAITELSMEHLAESDDPAVPAVPVFPPVS